MKSQENVECIIPEYQWVRSRTRFELLLPGFRFHGIVIRIFIVAQMSSKNSKKIELI